MNNYIELTSGTRVIVVTKKRNIMGFGSIRVSDIQSDSFEIYHLKDDEIREVIKALQSTLEDDTLDY